MHLSSRILSAALATILAVSALCLPASAAKYDTLTFPDAAGNQITYVDQQYQDCQKHNREAQGFRPASVSHPHHPLSQGSG